MLVCCTTTSHFYYHRNIGEKLELIKRLESGILVVRVCDEYGVKKQTDSDIRRSKDKLTSYVMKFDVAPSKDRKGALNKRKFLKVESRRKRFVSCSATVLSECERAWVRNR